MEWIDWVIIGALGAAIVWIVAYLIKQKKAGKGGCGCGCSGCPHAGACATKQTPSDNKTK